VADEHELKIVSELDEMAEDSPGAEDFRAEEGEGGGAAGGEDWMDMDEGGDASSGLASAAAAATAAAAIAEGGRAPASIGDERGVAALTLVADTQIAAGGGAVHPAGSSNATRLRGAVNSDPSVLSSGVPGETGKSEASDKDQVQMVTKPDPLKPSVKGASAVLELTLAKVKSVFNISPTESVGSAAKSESNVFCSTGTRRSTGIESSFEYHGSDALSLFFKVIEVSDMPQDCLLS
jgi:hypothetical protein